MNSHLQYPSHKNKALRRSQGKDLEDDLNRSNQTYRTMDKAIIHKKPTPISVVHVSYPKRSRAKITEAYYTIPSTTDYCGVYQGRYIDYEAKETQSETRFDLSLIHQHQYDHLIHISKHGGIAFLVIRFTRLRKDYVLSIHDLVAFKATSSRKSIPVEWIDKHAYPVPYRYKVPCDYLDAVESMMSKENL